MDELQLGAHMPSDGGPAGALRNGKEIGCTAVQVFTTSPRQWKAAPATEKKVEDFKKAVEETGITALVSHDSYLINLADPTEERRAKSIEGLTGEMTRCAAYGIPNVVSHMGAAMGQPAEVAIKKVSEAALQILDQTDPSVTLCMETTAGQGSSLNSSFEEIAKILDQTKNPTRLAVCIDTCHLYAAGYDLSTVEGFLDVFKRFDSIIGFEKLRVVHCNDSKKKLGSRVDRHDNLGEGLIGETAFRCLVHDSRFKNRPIVVETPIENDGHRLNVAKLWRWASEPSPFSPA